MHQGRYQQIAIDVHEADETGTREDDRRRLSRQRNANAREEETLSAESKNQIRLCSVRLRRTEACP